MMVDLTSVQAKLVRDLVATYLDTCYENAARGRTETADAKIARAVLRKLRSGAA